MAHSAIIVDMNDFTDELKFNLIELIQSESSLWNMKTQAYHKTKPKDKKKKWEAIAAILRTDGKRKQKIEAGIL
jgi:hypothetical protein